tara:strand:- start:235 stop:528 length:294 start_codon:yes stop_codon:yes gene_type:complete
MKSNYQILVHETRVWLDDEDEYVKDFYFGVTRYLTFNSLNEVEDLLLSNDLEIKHHIKENMYQCESERVEGDDYCTTWYIVIQKVEHQKLKTNLLKK